MSKEQFEGVYKEWKDDIHEWGFDNHWYNYRPFKDEYWNEKNKIVICNSESGDCMEENEQVLDMGMIKKWMNEDKDYKRPNPTILFSMVLASALHETLDTGKTLSEVELRKLKEDRGSLYNGLARCMYMNLRREANDRRKLDEVAVRKFLDPYYYSVTNKNNIDIQHFKDMVDALEPTVFIITGKVGYSVLYNMYNYDHDDLKKNKQELQLDWLGVCKYKNTVFASIKHPSMFEYKKCMGWIAKIVAELR